MPATLQYFAETGVAEIQLSGKLDRPDYEQFVPEVEQLFRDHGKLRALVELKDFHGWTASGFWEDIKFNFRHFNDIERLAIVGEKRWHEGMTTLCKPFTSARIRYFEQFEYDDAKKWIVQERSAPPTQAATEDRPLN